MVDIINTAKKVLWDDTVGGLAQGGLTTGTGGLIQGALNSAGNAFGFDHLAGGASGGSQASMPINEVAAAEPGKIDRSGFGMEEVIGGVAGAAAGYGIGKALHLSPGMTALATVAGGLLGAELGDTGADALSGLKDKLPDLSSAVPMASTLLGLGTLGGLANRTVSPSGESAGFMDKIGAMVQDHPVLSGLVGAGLGYAGAKLLPEQYQTLGKVVLPVITGLATSGLAKKGLEAFMGNEDGVCNKAAAKTAPPQMAVRKAPVIDVKH